MLSKIVSPTLDSVGNGVPCTELAAKARAKVCVNDLGDRCQRMQAASASIEGGSNRSPGSALRGSPSLPSSSRARHTHCNRRLCRINTASLSGRSRLRLSLFLSPRRLCTRVVQANSACRVSRSMNRLRRAAAAASRGQAEKQCSAAAITLRQCKRKNYENRRYRPWHGGT